MLFISCLKSKVDKFSFLQKSSGKHYSSSHHPKLLNNLSSNKQSVWDEFIKRQYYYKHPRRGKETFLMFALHPGKYYLLIIN